MKTLCALTLAVGLLGSCTNQHEERLQSWKRCQEQVVEMREMAQENKIQSIEDALDSKDWCKGESLELWSIYLMVSKNLYHHCIDKKLSVYEILKKEEDPFKILVFGNQGNCISPNRYHDKYLHDINTMQNFIDTYKEGEKQ